MKSWSRLSKSRSRDAILERLGLISVSRISGKVSVSVSFQTENRMSRSRLGLGTQRFVLQAHFQRQMFTKLSTVIMLSVVLYSTACCHVKTETCVNVVLIIICFYAIDSLSSFIIKHLCYLVKILMN